jgi:hypothetical protein
MLDALLTGNIPEVMLSLEAETIYWRSGEKATD